MSVCWNSLCLKAAHPFFPQTEHSWGHWQPFWSQPFLLWRMHLPASRALLWILSMTSRFDADPAASFLALPPLPAPFFLRSLPALPPRGSSAGEEERLPISAFTIRVTVDVICDRKLSWEEGPA